MVAEMLAAGLNANCGGRSRHCDRGRDARSFDGRRKSLGFPNDSSGIFVHGDFGREFVSTVLIARDVPRSATEFQAGRASGDGVPQLKSPYTLCRGTWLHSARQSRLPTHRLAFRCVPSIGRRTQAHCALDLLWAQVAADQGAGLKPFVVVGTAGHGEYRGYR